MKLFHIKKTKNSINISLLGLKISHKNKKNKTLSEIYDGDFYKMQAQASYESGKKVLHLVHQIFPDIKSVLDIGCGVGTWLKAWQNISKDIKVLGIDGNTQSEAFLYIPKKQLLTKNIIHLDFHEIQPQHFDLTECLEVAEHLPASEADNFIKTLTSFSDLILFSAAAPYQPGTFHVNNQEPAYWQAKFKQYGFECFDILRLKIWNDESICWWYRQNILIFARNSAKTSLIKKGYEPVKKASLLYHSELMKFYARKHQ